MVSSINILPTENIFLSRIIAVQPSIVKAAMRIWQSQIVLLPPILTPLVRLVVTKILLNEIKCVTRTCSEVVNGPQRSTLTSFPPWLAELSATGSPKPCPDSPGRSVHWRWPVPIHESPSDSPPSLLQILWFVFLCCRTWWRE